MNIIVVDCETMGLDIVNHPVWEVGAIEITDKGEKEYKWFLEVSKHYSDPSHADPIALQIGGFFERYPWSTGKDVTPTSQFAEEFFQLSKGKTWVGAVPDFDAYRIANILRINSFPPMWDYHLVCVEVLAAGFLGIRPPWKSDAVFEKLGINKNDYERHTAIGDCRLARDVYFKVFPNGN